MGDFRVEITITSIKIKGVVTRNLLGKDGIYSLNPKEAIKLIKGKNVKS